MIPVDYSKTTQANNTIISFLCLPQQRNKYLTNLSKVYSFTLLSLLNRQLSQIPNHQMSCGFYNLVDMLVDKHCGHRLYQRCHAKVKIRNAQTSNPAPFL